MKSKFLFISVPKVPPSALLRYTSCSLLLGLTNKTCLKKLTVTLNHPKIFLDRGEVSLKHDHCTTLSSGQHTNILSWQFFILLPRTKKAYDQDNNKERTNTNYKLRMKNEFKPF
ncbi:MAG: hypothetical protein ABWZ79_15115 [Pedobacter agri]